MRKKGRGERGIELGGGQEGIADAQQGEGDGPRRGRLAVAMDTTTSTHNVGCLDREKKERGEVAFFIYLFLDWFIRHHAVGQNHSGLGQGDAVVGVADGVGGGGAEVDAGGEGEEEGTLEDEGVTVGGVDEVVGEEGPGLSQRHQLRAQRWLDTRAVRGGRERADAPHDLHGGGQAEVQRFYNCGNISDSYTEYLKDIEAGKIENVPTPPIAIDYWRLPADATLKDVVVVVCADEAHHRDVNHFASDVHFQGMDLKDTPALLDYH
uniref:Ubiquinol oxidase n=1 Tax=Oryza sativa subsp. japonica TaxID=39947 RepID=Q33B30_ORYSJ|nr:transposon protein, putative, unclassified [Oryza sativa Japonica Group]